VGEHGRADGGGEVFPALVETPKQAQHPLEERDRAFDPRAKALSMPERGVVFPFRFLLGPTPELRDGDELHLLAQILERADAFVVALVGSDFPGILPEQTAMAFHRGAQELMLDGLLIEGLVVGDEFLADLLDLDHVTELDGLSRFSPLEEFRVRLEDAEELLVIGNRVTLEDPPPGLIDHSRSQVQVVFQVLREHLGDDVIEQGVAVLLPSAAKLLHHLPGPFENGLQTANQLVIEGFEFGRGVLFSRLAPDFPSQTLGAAGMKTLVADGLGVQVPSALDQAREHSIGIPQEGRIGRIMDVGLDGRGVEPDFLAADQILLGRMPAQKLVHRLPRGGQDRVLQLVERREVHHGPVINADKAPQEIAVVDPDDDLPQRCSFDDLAQEDPENLIGSEGVRPPRPCL